MFIIDYVDQAEVFSYGNGHQLVGLTFLGYDRKNNQNLVIDHLNMIKTDNRLCNLQVVTQKQNKIRYFKTEKGQQTRNKMRGPRGSYKVAANGKIAE